MNPTIQKNNNKITFKDLFKYFPHFWQKMPYLTWVAHLNVDIFEWGNNQNNRMLSAVILVVEMLKNMDFDGSYGRFSKTSV